MFLQEGPSDQDLKTNYEFTLKGVKTTQLIKMLAPELNEYYVKDKSSKHSYFPKSAYNSITKIVQKHYMSLLGEQEHNKGFLVQVVLEVYREGEYLEELELLKLLAKHKIHFAGIDAETTIFSNQMISSSTNNYSYVNNESQRIDTMVENVYKEVTANFKEGGIAFVSVGNNHAHRLAANLEKEFKSKEKDVAIQSFNYFSSYFKEWMGNLDYALEITSDLDSDEIKEIYKTLPSKLISCLEKDAQFIIPDLEEICNNYIKQQQQSILTTPKSHSIFSPELPHDKLVIELKNYVTKYPKTVNDTFIYKTVEIDKDYTLAFRNVCAWGNYDLVKLFLKFSIELPIDFNKTSSNLKTPLDWFESSKASVEQKNEIKIILSEKMAQQGSFRAPNQ